MANVNDVLSIERVSMFSAYQLFDATKSAILNDEVDKVKVYQFFDLCAKAFDMLKKDEQTKTAIQNQFLAYGSKGQQMTINGFNVKVYDKATYTKDAFIETAIREEQTGYTVILEEIERLSSEKKQYEEYMLQNFDVAKKYITITEIAAKRVI